MNLDAGILTLRGFTEHLTPGVPDPWYLSAAFRNVGFTQVTDRECVQNNDPDSVIPGDFIGKKAAFGFSFGGSSLALNWNHWQGDLAVLVLAVPDGPEDADGGAR